jgi:signal transduction histidine kinase
MRRIEDVNRELDAFAGRIAHDLRNALAPLELSSKVFELSPEDPGVVAETGARIERATRRAADLITGLLAFARAGSPAEGAASLGELWTLRSRSSLRWPRAWTHGSRSISSPS